MKVGQEHKHHFDTLVETRVAVRKMKKVKGGWIADTMTASDTLKQRKCVCGAVETYDMERRLA